MGASRRSANYLRARLGSQMLVGGVEPPKLIGRQVRAAETIALDIEDQQFSRDSRERFNGQPLCVASESKLGRLLRVKGFSEAAQRAQVRLPAIIGGIAGMDFAGSDQSFG
jgi:hypothetical protein